MRDEETPRCPRCGSLSGVINNFPIFICRDCGYTWDIDEDEVMIHERD